MNISQFIPSLLHSVSKLRILPLNYTKFTFIKEIYISIQHVVCIFYVNQFMCTPVLGKAPHSLKHTKKDIKNYHLQQTTTKTTTRE